ncbi:cytoplasmic protein [Xenorhabdus mauleonii]|uniref:Cytoplasmic protein n=1 Tax=Xenorhabdus mauleonii TaxID=351675 RepID=A0A1I3U0J4_9GAMM|nr:hypothetical protein [Xenorhabdus mauleonii]PHM39527.1 cytoplasmic protein [Xenorhabdus mauleonii]SFJ76243.1 hypothetical protein SAMN05421680_11599 [Xenorhabdus mauleonii]
MSKEQELTAYHSVFELSQWIEDVFTNQQQKGSEALEKLLNSFTPDFAMITTAGQYVTLEQVKEMFNLNAGARAGLKIEIDECKVMTSNDEEVVLRYREKQTKDGVSHNRWSMVIISCIDGYPRWRYLHETAIAE